MKNLVVNSKPITVRTIYHPPVQSNFFAVLNGIYILGDFNTKYLQSVPSDVKSCNEFCTNFGLKQLIKV